jgi:Spy/CpxP family protein refolding chaperone
MMPWFDCRVRPLATLLTTAALWVVGPPAMLSAQRVDPAPARVGAPTQEGGGLERQFRERLAEVVRRRLNLDDAQMRQLGQVNSRFERDRLILLRDERRVRQSLRAEVLAGDSANQPRVSDLLDQALKIQQRRLDLTAEEQRELSAFMTPVQRAKYFAIQDDLRRRMEELRQNRQERQRRTGALGPGGRRAPLP